ncbi:MAG: flagellar hook protein FlgE [Nevskiaceae bacterium]|nr:MAG: flagellar hook protein FlgE [Nevskiaceae bacterium]TBR71557.1 MAG: flagellar hook protein FlgE [Nevskiaceae bacterium]
MSFNIALSGLNAASNDLDVTSNNIANANTTGFKSSRAEFGDVFAQAANNLSNSLIGSGVKLESVAQNFGQGNVNFTNNTLDLAISGSGFFTLSNNGSIEYSRAGAFGPDNQGFVVNSSGQRLQVYPASPVTGVIDTGRLSDLQLSTANNPPSATTTISAGVNLQASATPPTLTPFDPTDPNTYNSTSSLTVFDSLGASHTTNLFFTKTATPNEWTVQTRVDGADVGGPQILTYDGNGVLISPANGRVTLPAVTLANGATPLNMTLDLSGSTQFGDQYAVASLQQNGFATGRLSGLSVSSSGVVQANFTNGQSKPLGQVALSNFTNAQGLQQLGDTKWSESFSSGQPIRGAAGAGAFGNIQSGALEASNVDISKELVNLITAQRNYQANAQSIQAESTITQTILQVR